MSTKAIVLLGLPPFSHFSLLVRLDRSIQSNIEFCNDINQCTYIYIFISQCVSVAGTNETIHASYTDHLVYFAVFTNAEW